MHKLIVFLLAPFISQSQTSNEKQFCLSSIIFLLGQKYVLKCVFSSIFPIHCEVVEVFSPLAK